MARDACTANSRAEASTSACAEFKGRVREHGIRARHQRRFKATTDARHSLPVAPNRLARSITPAAPNRVWTGDITDIQTGEGWLYLTIILGLFNREIVGWSIKPRMSADIVTDALTMAGSEASPRQT